jgi:hypothetical protein
MILRDKLQNPYRKQRNYTLKHVKKCLATKWPDSDINKKTAKIITDCSNR